MSESKLTIKQTALLAKLPKKIQFGDPDAVALVMAGLAYRAPILNLKISDAGRRFLGANP